MTLISNSSILPSRRFFKTNKRLFALIIKKDDILKIIRKLNVNKAHGHDDISIRMLKICDSVITEPLSIIFKNCIDCGVFADTGKCLILYQPIKRMINALLIIIAQCLFYLFFMFFFIS